MWWDMAAAMRHEFEDWHSHEHFPERMGIPGFRRGSRWTSADGGEGIFVMYELDNYEVLASPGYLARLNAPTPWSTKMMPHHRNMVRSQNPVLESAGGAIARQALTIRLSPASGNDDALRAALKSAIATLAMRPGLCGAHLLKHQAPAIAQTAEQKIRATPDRVADWVLVVTGYEADALQALTQNELAEPALVRMGAAPGITSGIYSLSYSATTQETTP
jgi:hypothetical protein